MSTHEDASNLSRSVLSVRTLAQAATLDSVTAAFEKELDGAQSAIDALLAGCGAVVTDIEGTTTPIPFVTTVLFPYAEERVATYVAEHYDALASVVDGMRSDAAGTAAPAISPASAGKDAVVASLVENFLYNSKANFKVTSMKELQGKIWKDGYADGSLKGKVFDDVRPAFERWVAQGKKVYIYSSGSIGAQKLLFGQSTQGDLLPQLSGHYDTTTGPKREAESYRKIAASVGLPASEVLFLTDMVQEAVAAEAAGMRAVLLHRRQNLPYDARDTADSVRFLQLTSFDRICPAGAASAVPPAKRAKTTD